MPASYYVRCTTWNSKMIAATISRKWIEFGVGGTMQDVDIVMDALSGEGRYTRSFVLVFVFTLFLLIYCMQTTGQKKKFQTETLYDYDWHANPCGSTLATPFITRHSTLSANKKQTSKRVFMDLHSFYFVIYTNSLLHNTGTIYSSALINLLIKWPKKKRSNLATRFCRNISAC